MHARVVVHLYLYTSLGAGKGVLFREVSSVLMYRNDFWFDSV